VLQIENRLECPVLQKGMNLPIVLHDASIKQACVKLVKFFLSGTLRSRTISRSSGSALPHPLTKS
jgi:hypothetical protein